MTAHPPTDVAKTESLTAHHQNNIDYRQLRPLLEKMLQEPVPAPQMLPANQLTELLKLGKSLATSESKSRNYQAVVATFLSISRLPTVLRRVAAEGVQERWFKAILALVQKTNFTVGRLFEQRLEEYGQEPLFKVVKGKHISDYSYSEVKQRIDSIVRGLFALGTENPADIRIAILSENSLEMACIDLACLCTGIVDIPVPANSTSRAIEFILGSSGATVVFVSGEQRLTELLNIKNPPERLTHIVALNVDRKYEDARILSFDEFLQRGASTTVDIDELIRRVRIDDLATIMYTSGTTEAPKGIMFSQLNLVSKRFARAIALPEIGDQDRFICYLPLFHTFGRFFEMLGCVFWGATYVFLENPGITTITATMRLTKPTVFISIPKKWMQLYEQVQEKVDIEHAPSEEIQSVLDHCTGGMLKWGLSAAGYLDPDIFRFFQQSGIELMSGFGMTEATGGITMTPPFDYHPNSVGKPLPGIEIRLAEDGEMLIKGPYVMQGYLDVPNGGLHEGWLPTGDIFSRDDEGHLQIIDRKKEIYKNIRGETIAPQKIENLFHDFEAVKRVFLVGDHKAYNTLLIYPNYEYPQADLSAMSPAQQRKFFSSVIESVNQFLAPFERIVNFKIIDREFSTDHGELTPKGTFKRKAVEENFVKEIKEMYEKDYVSLALVDFEIRVPNWFLREKALTAEDLRLRQSAIVAASAGPRLSVDVHKSKSRYRVRLGDFNYSVGTRFLDLGRILEDPALWLGNIELERFAGDMIFERRPNFRASRADIELEPGFRAEKLHRNVLSNFNAIVKREIMDARGVHLAAYLLHSIRETHALKAVTYLELVVQNKNETTAPLARETLLRAAAISSVNVMRRGFLAIVLNEQRDLLGPILKRFLVPNHNLLDTTTIEKIAQHNLTARQLASLLAYSSTCLKAAKSGRQNLSRLPIAGLLQLLTAYGAHHPLSYKGIRLELTKWKLFAPNASLRAKAVNHLNALQKGFRKWLGDNLQIAIHPETLTEFSWDDVAIFEETIPAADRKKIFTAIRQVPLIREAIFLFSGGRLVQLNEIPQQGIWISLLGSRHEKSVYRVTVQTYHYGSFDFAINVNESRKAEEVQAEIDWLVCTGATDDRSPLVEDFGGYWRKYDLWTEEFIPGDTVEKYLRRLDRRTAKQGVDRMQQLWPSFVWSGLSAYVDFWNRTGRRLEIADPTPANVTVPLHDYQVGFRIVSIAARRPFRGIVAMLVAFREQFVQSVENQYPHLRGVCKWYVIFSAFLEVLGQDEGLTVLRSALQTCEKSPDRDGSGELCRQLGKYMRNVTENGYLPERLYFAIQRYRRWHSLNPAATGQARLQTLKDLETTYVIDQMETQYPGSRIQFFRDTVFSESSPKIRKGLNAILTNVREDHRQDFDLQEQFANLARHVELTQEEQMFLTRLSYPHLGTREAAEMISLNLQGGQKTALVVFTDDDEGNQIAIRNPASPKEIARLHRLFTEANLPVEFTSEHEFLVVLNERGAVIGGLFYQLTEPGQAHLEKVVVDQHDRKKGISDALLKEFFNRLRTQGIEIVSVGFLRPEYFYKFGFKTDHRYGNLIKRLDTAPESDRVEEFLDSI